MASMKKILVILDGIVAKKLLERMVETNTGENNYDVIYMYDAIIPKEKPANFTFYKFDPTSSSKLSLVLQKDIHIEVLLSLSSKDETLNVIKNIREQKPNIQISILDYWGINIDDDMNVIIYKGIEVLANGMLEKLPNMPVIAQNIGLRHGEIMEIRIPFGSSYAYRHIGSIEQKEWKIFGLYRNQRLIPVNKNLILKPNDIILIIGEPRVVMQVYTAISKTQGQFPMPFGENIYLYLDLYILEEEELKILLRETRFLNKRLKNKNLYIKITRPTTVDAMRLIKDEFKKADNVDIEVDYYNKGFKNIINLDLKRYHIGMMVVSKELLKLKEVNKRLLELRVPIFKVGNNPEGKTKEIVILLNDTKSYEQISPTIFDISSQLKVKTKIFDLDPIGEDEKNSNILEHFENLSKIFNHNIEITSANRNPIRELKRQKNILQLMPLKEEMFKKRRLKPFFYTNSDMLAFDMSDFNQLLIPVIE